MKKYLPLLLLAFAISCNNADNNVSTEERTNTDNISSGLAAPQNISINIIGVYPHDTSAYTQGLQLYNGKLYEGTGDYETSSMRITDIKSGKVEKKHLMGSNKIFGEGINIFNDKIYQLTWQNNVVNVYDVANIDKVITTFKWPYEGWGITNNGKDLIISDGSANLYFVNAADFKIKSTMQVTDNIGPVNMLNELEYIDGFVYANVYQSDYIVKIDPANGHIVGKISLPGILQQYAPGQIVPERTDVLNGIAWDSSNKKIYLTGKRWPKLFEATLN
ncbi:MAG: glutaminyl-peptide cyclotransferase [Sphingobacteriales bacterium]|nr:glutaminyl-peptide cyclotransferase [Sphingobacteriales bacterium]